ncbi:MULTISPECIES: ABC transporter permease [Pseudothermotoga]|jgi:ABC-2 type transport system permease protein|uniref:Transport permease protein n=1 Tax=Pseudothermotoga lettingae (strain ATCC BAA-301 / DSM 14385 / NBRC 107922 / TMO) TaxID=416591 RepID=A8F622_PSELT|nr:MULTISPECIES: ABC transporter permease [Pseudothermotoga]MDI3495058.1 type transport system permease protein [Pseudothermotoga sp.]ABV33606.1 ABC-2 type transporter [Pseudothermotoga lettingae TMO]KUK20526.1 MAG: ABC-2 type transporter [Pseudothermotoga lettingae]GLI49478.1 multidrug ABC transporter permease [Pseudothermotoga lettingae TMO]HBT25771.1 ABC transporter permease [Pseudothermotoga sp.]
MEFIVHELRAALAFIERNFNLIKRYWKWEIVFFAYTIANTVTMGFIGKGAVSFGATVDVNYLIMYMLIGSILWGYLSVLFEIVAETVAWERWEDTIEYTFMAPVKRITHLLSVCFFSVMYGVLRSGLILVFVSLLFKLNLSEANFASAGLVLATASISFIGLGVAGAVLPLISPEKGVQVVHIFQALLLMFSGVYYEIDVLPEWMQKVAALSPATYALRGMRAAILNGANSNQLFQEIKPLLFLGVILLPAGIVVFNYVEKYAKKKGLLKRSG